MKHKQEVMDWLYNMTTDDKWSLLEDFVAENESKYAEFVERMYKKNN